MSAIVQACLCLLICSFVGLLYRPKPCSRYRPGVSFIAFLVCSVTGMQAASLFGRIFLHQEFADASWFNTVFYALFLWLTVRARGNIAKIWTVPDDWDGEERRNTEYGTGRRMPRHD